MVLARLTCHSKGQKKIWFLALDIWVIFVHIFFENLMIFVATGKKLKHPLQPQIKLLGNKWFTSFKNSIWWQKKSDVHGSPGILFKKILKENRKNYLSTLNWCLVDLCHFLLQRRFTTPPKKKKKKHPALGTSKKSPKKRNFGTATCTQSSVKKLKAISFSQILRCSEVVFPEDFFGDSGVTTLATWIFSLQKSPWIST